MVVGLAAPPADNVPYIRMAWVEDPAADKNGADEETEGVESAPEPRLRDLLGVTLLAAVGLLFLAAEVARADNPFVLEFVDEPLSCFFQSRFDDHDRLIVDDISQQLLSGSDLVDHLIAVLLLLHGRFAEAVVIFMAGAWKNEAPVRLKDMVQRPRPNGHPGYSFPSRHTTVFVLNMGLVLLVALPAFSEEWRQALERASSPAAKRWGKAGLGAAYSLLTWYPAWLLLAGSVMGFCRVGCGWHWFTDTLAGGLLATVILAGIKCMLVLWARYFPMKLQVLWWRAHHSNDI